MRLTTIAVITAGLPLAGTQTGDTWSKWLAWRSRRALAKATGATCAAQISSSVTSLNSSLSLRVPRNDHRPLQLTKNVVLSPRQENVLHVSHIGKLSEKNCFKYFPNFRTCQRTLQAALTFPTSSVYPTLSVVVQTEKHFTNKYTFHVKIRRQLSELSDPISSGSSIALSKSTGTTVKTAKPFEGGRSVVVLK